MTKKVGAQGQQPLGAPPEIKAIIASKPLEKRDLRSLWPGWKTVFFGMVRYRLTLMPSKEDGVSLLDRIILECLEYDKALSSEELWIKCYEQTGYQIGPKTFAEGVRKLVDCGLIESVE